MEFKISELNEVTAAADWAALGAIGAGVVVGIICCD